MTQRHWRGHLLRDDGAADHRVTSIELFFDLVYVFAITQLSHLLLTHLDVRGALHRVPLSGGLFLAGFLAITGAPPFGPFVSEFTIVNAGFASGQYLVGGLFLFLLGVVFMGMGSTVLTVS